MLDQNIFYYELKKNDVSFFTGVPDSFLNGFCNFLLENVPSDHNIIAANEGNAIGIASGHYFATKEVPFVYMQNSGLGNTINPLASLADENVYAVPMILLIGWRGEPGTELKHPQHWLQGEITPKLLDVLHIPYVVLEDDNEKIADTLKKAADYCKTRRKPFALIARKGVMAGEKANNKDAVYPMCREEAIETIINCMPEDTIYSATTGRATRELFFIRERKNQNLSHDYLNVGSMGHASSVAFGIALAQPDRKVVCFDGDAAAIMHMGSFAMASKNPCPNFIHIVLNNGAHESVGGQPSVGHMIDFTQIAQACGYETIGKPVTTKDELIEAVRILQKAEKTAFLDVRIHKGLNGKLPPLDFDHREAIDSLINELN